MPNKKSKANASKNKTSGLSAEPTQASSSLATTIEPPVTTSASYVAPTLAPPSFSVDFWTKNARAKALIMSTLVPGSEAWKVAEPLELASDIWKALEEKYSPKDGKGKLKLGNLPAAGNKGGRDDSKGQEHTNSSQQPSSDFIGDFVAGKPMDKYLDMYKDKLAMTQLCGATSSSSHKREVPVPAASAEDAHRELEPSTVVNAAKLEGEREQSQPSALTSVQTQPRTLPPATATVGPAPLTNPLPSACERWKAHPVRHDSYLSEYQASVFAQHDQDRKKQIQVAATKVLMQKLPTRDLRLLWAVLYGGENAPWPGSCSAVIPGVTSLQWQNKNYEIDYTTCAWSWNNKTEEKG